MPKRGYVSLDVDHLFSSALFQEIIKGDKRTSSSYSSTTQKKFNKQVWCIYTTLKHLLESIPLFLYDIYSHLELEQNDQWSQYHLHFNDHCSYRDCYTGEAHIFFSNAYVVVSLVVWSKNIIIDRSRSSVPKWNCTSSYLKNNCNCDMVKITDITCNTISRSKNIFVYLVLNVLQSM